MHPVSREPPSVLLLIKRPFAKAEPGSFEPLDFLQASQRFTTDKTTIQKG